MLRDSIRPRPIHGWLAAFAVLAVLAVLGVCTLAQARTPPPFPRIGGIQIGGPFNYNDPAYQAQLARQSLMILNYWPGMAPGGESMDRIVKAIKAINPSALVFLYTESDEQFPTVTGADATLRAKLNAMHWWLYTDPRDEDKVPAAFGDGGDTINNTPYTPEDANGDDSIDWITKWFVSNYYTPNPDIDGFFMDNVTVQPMVAGDWYRNGVVLQPADPKAAAAIQAGYERWFALVRQLMPGKYQIGNVATWAQRAAIPAGFQGMADGGVMEALIGKPYSTESWGSWQKMMQQYAAVMAALRAPKLAIFNQWGNPTDYQAFRYGFASCLMNNAYYSFTSDAKGYSGVVWFDEYNARLGMPVGAPPTTAWQKGVWRRDFVNGIALVNPKGNGAQTVDLGGTFVKIRGSQDPAVNDGRTVTSVTLKDRDGLILLRQSPLQQPMSPGGVTVGTG